MEYEDQPYQAPKRIGERIISPCLATLVGGARPSESKNLSSERAELIGVFTDKLNAARKGTNWKPLTPAYVNKILAKRYPTKSLEPLYHLKGRCEEAEKLGIMPFSAQFFMVVNKQAEQLKLL